MDIAGDEPPNEQNDDNLNISDVLEALIRLEEPIYGPGMSRQDDGPYVRIVEQPASKALRFRYPCEGRSAGSMPGVNSTSENKTYPTIRICGHEGEVAIVVSCVTKDKFLAHPHNLVGRERCNKGVCTIKTTITKDNCEYEFKNLGVQCVKRRDIASALMVREGLKVDPFKKGFDHKNHPQSIDLNAIRLCFQVFVPDKTGFLRRPLVPVVSDVIYDKKAMSDLLIMRASHCSGTARGGTQVILLCEKVTREDTAVVFYQEENNMVVWEVTLTMIQVHKQVAITFETPPYRNPDVQDHVNVRFQLKRISDNARSNSLPFEYIPELSDIITSKRRKMVNSMLQNYDHDRLFQQDNKPMKTEPRDRTPPHHVSSPPLHVYPPTYGQQNWGMENMQGGQLGLPGSSNNSFVPDMWHSPSYSHSPLQSVSPGLHASSNMQQMQQNLHAPSPNMQPLSPNMHAQNLHAPSPNMQPLSPNMHAQSLHAPSPNMQPLSPMHAQNLHAASPNMQSVSPNMQQMSANLQVLQPAMQLSPGMQGSLSMSGNMPLSPNMAGNMPLSPNMSGNMPLSPEQLAGRLSPSGRHHATSMGHISPNLVQQSVYGQQPQQQCMAQNIMDTDQHSSASISHLLQMSREDVLMNSGELSGLQSLLGDQ